ncbi:ets DNA-binding protein pokkuri isoform X3 [Nilaparvata lugens]|uniref:ets DNA-binding protein pokkuri isoform X3 n=1 Tax=Nilaparvata lugens TaxID=108931 RepID=UPI00193CE7FD|nr:ets DNA-binding protein pokkuri isoform X3 [Nilaparvata lugens]
MEVLPAAQAGVGRFPFPPELLWKYRMSFPPQMDFRTQLPRKLGNDPRQWSRESVASFLQWCQYEFDLPQFNMEKFQMNGKALCLLTKSDLAERSPGSGDVLHNVLQMLMRDSSCTVDPHAQLTPHFSPHAGWPPLLQGGPLQGGPPAQPPVSFSVTLSPVPPKARTTSAVNVPRVTLSPAPPPTSPSQHDSIGQYSGLRTNDRETQCRSPHSPCSPSATHLCPPASSPSRKAAEPQLSPAAAANAAATAMHSSCSNTPPHSPNNKVGHFTAAESVSPAPETNSNGRLLWDFLQQLLNDSQQRYTAYIAWKNQESGVFKIVDPPGLAKLWGIQKNHLSMNYDKMSRALRYYYRVNILRKVQGERHCYQFLRNPSELRSIKNMSLLRQQAAQQTTQAASQYVKSEPQYVKSEFLKSEPQDSAIDHEQEEEDMQPTDLSVSSSSSSWSQENCKSEPVENNNNTLNNNNNATINGQDMKLQLNMWTHENGKMKINSPTSRLNVHAIKAEDSS